MLGITQGKIAESPGITRTCEHCRAVDILWITNEAGKMPEVIVENKSGRIFILGLTNQTFYVKCPACWQRDRLQNPIQNPC